MFQNYWPFLVFVVAMTGTPGPGNLALMAIGQSSGFRAALPFLCGVALGFATLTALIGFGLGEAVNASPAAGMVLKIAGSLYILYLAFKTLRLQVSPPDVSRRFTFGEGLLLHPLSPKSWGMLVASAGQFLQPGDSMGLKTALFAGTFFVFMLGFHSLWCLAGASILRALGSRGALTAVTACMAMLMVGATAYALFA